MSAYKHWELHIDSANIVWLGINRHDTAVNSINHEVLDELNSVLQDLAQQDDLGGLVIYSKKTKGFIAGADVHAFSAFKTTALVADFLRKGQAVFARLESLPIPTVAMIDGFCMGGGLELALACDYRVASDDSSTVLGLPEVRLGIHPGWGGAVRLPRLIGGWNALSKFILSGAAVPAIKAKRLGLVDEVVPVRMLRRAVCHFIATCPPKQQPNFLQSLSNNAWIRPLVAKVLRFGVAKKIKKEHYPAPFAAIDFWEKESSYDERAYLKEADSVERLVTESDTSKNLIRAFFLRERMKSFAKEVAFKAQRVHVIGAGTMGGDIAAWCALSGLQVTLQDQSHAKIAPAIARAHKLFSKKLKSSRLMLAMDRLTPDVSGDGIAHADVIIEAVFEDCAVKRAIMKTVEERAKEGAIIATNTSSIPLDEISCVMENPGRLVGIHFFNPVARMELVEVVSSAITLPDVSLRALAFVGQINRLPLPVTSSPGFLVNRVLMPYLMECVQLLDEGVAPEVIDSAALNFGMLMGPVELADTVGLDVCLAVAENLTTHFDGSIPKKLRDMVQAGKFGRKTGEGFYCYKNGKASKQANIEKSEEQAQDIAHRLVLRMLNTATECLRDGVVHDADLLDAAMIFGTGFAPFRGGLMHYADAFGRDNLHKLFKRLEEQHGARFKSYTCDAQ